MYTNSLHSVFFIISIDLEIPVKNALKYDPRLKALFASELLRGFCLKYIERY